MTTDSSSAFEPVRIGPTWQRNEDGSWLLPERSIGWHVLGWTATWLKNYKTKTAWRYTPEQTRFLLWWFAVDDNGKFVYRNAVLQRLKGWGKDPLAATLSLVELVGPSQPSGEVAKRNNPYGVREGQPLGQPHEAAWIQIAATSLDQTKNTMRVFPTLFTDGFLKQYDVDPGKTVIHAHNGAQTIEAVTSSPTTLEGARSTLVIANETHHWRDNNGGTEMWDVLERNVAKGDVEAGAARVLSITNAYQPGLDSVAERVRDSMERVWAGDAADFGLLYDSLEASPKAPLTAEAAPLVLSGDGTPDNPGIRGDSVWLSTENIVKSILDTSNPPSRSRRFWYNQIVANEDNWVTWQDWDAIEDPELELKERDYIALFFDGSKSDDNTALVACRIEDGAVFKQGVWIPSKEHPVDRDAVSAVVAQSHANYRVVGFFADPGSGEDETGERYWDKYIDDWSNRFGDKYVVKPVQSGMKKHSVMWPMIGNMRQEEFTHAVERTYADIIAGSFKHNGDRKLRQHILNAKRRPNDWGITIGKRHRMAKEKIDLAVCMVGARMVRRLVLGSDQWQKLMNKPTGKGRVIVLR